MPGRFNLARRPFVDTRPANLAAGFLAVLVLALSFVAARTVIRAPSGTSSTATRVPWIDANGWQFERAPTRSYFYDAPAGTAVRAAAEALERLRAWGSGRVGSCCVSHRRRQRRSSRIRPGSTQTTARPRTTRGAAGRPRSRRITSCST